MSADFRDEFIHGGLGQVPVLNDVSIPVHFACRICIRQIAEDQKLQSKSIESFLFGWEGDEQECTSEKLALLLIGACSFPSAVISL